MATNYEINYNDERFKQVESDKTEALSDLEKTYAGMIDSSDAYYQSQIDASKQWADKQSQLQQEKTDFAIEQIEQQKAQAQKDYTKEQSGAYVDWQKQSNPYGAKSEQVASAGMTNTGFSESAQVSMYNTYQSRITAARESYNNAVLNYNNAIKDARLQNNSVLAEIAYEALQQQLELSLQGFQYKNQLILEKANKKTELENAYYSRYQDVLQQINTENALAEDIRQYNEQMALEREKFAEDQRQFNILHSGSGSGSSKTIYKSKTSDDKQEFTSEVKEKTGGIVDKKVDSSSDDSKTMKSILALGDGPISANTLAKGVASGRYKEVDNSSGAVTFIKTGQIGREKYTSLLK